MSIKCCLTCGTCVILHVHSNSFCQMVKVSWDTHIGIFMDLNIELIFIPFGVDSAFCDNNI